jgi:hypothetical protein
MALCDRVRRSLAPPPTPYVTECQRLMTARLAATSKSEKDDAEWALQYAMQMHRAGRFEEYLAQRVEQLARHSA